MNRLRFNNIKLPNLKKAFRIKNKLKVSLIGAIMLTTVGYASLNSSLGIEGLISILQNADFNVFFSKTLVDGIEKISLIDAGSQSITLTSSDISSENQTVIDYTITNASRQYNAEVSIKCDPEISNGIALTYNKSSSLIEANNSLSGTITTAITGEGDTTSTDRLERLVDIIRKQSKGSDTTNNINYSDMSSSQNGNGVYTTNNTDSGKSIYFFRGNVNNNVVFAEKCWKMVRTTETDGVKLIYNGDYVNGRCNGTNPVVASNISYSHDKLFIDNAYVGYMYGTANSTTYEETHKNTNNSNLKKSIDDWYQKNIFSTSYESYLEDTVYCNDRSLVSGNGFGGGTDYESRKEFQTLYGFSQRGGQEQTEIHPTLKCKNENDRFTVSKANGNGALTYPVAVLTADEVVYAGGKAGPNTETMGSPKQNMNFYLYSPTISWTMTPSGYSPATIEIGSDGGTSVQARSVTLYQGAVKSDQPVYIDYNNAYTMTARPVLSVKGDTRVRTGDGTALKPYVLESDKYDKFTCTININKVEQSEGGSGIGGYQKLYDFVKGESLGVDTERNIDYDKISSDTNGKGVYSTTDTDSGKEVYFYRGNIETNNIVFAEKCWKILRTTETGGTKLVYNGEKTADGTCENTGANASIGDSAWHTVAGTTIYKDSAVKGVVDS